MLENKVTTKDQIQVHKTTASELVDRLVALATHQLAEPPNLARLRMISRLGRLSGRLVQKLR